MPDHTFPEDHPVQALRGEERLKATTVRRALGRRADWLQRGIEQRAREGKPYDLYVEELKAITQALEKFPPRVVGKGDER